MKKTIGVEKTLCSLFLLMIITGAIFTACGPVVEQVEDGEDSGTAEMEIIDKVQEKDVEGGDEKNLEKIELKTEIKKGSEATTKTEPKTKTEAESETKSEPPIDKGETVPVSEPVNTQAENKTEVEVSDPVVEVKIKYADGTYIKSGSYQSPAGSESVTVTVTVKDDVVQSVSVASNAVNETSKQLQGLFISGVNSLVVGKKLDEVFVSGNVNGSSLTSTGFNNALTSIKAGALR